MRAVRGTGRRRDGERETERRKVWRLHSRSPGRYAEAVSTGQATSSSRSSTQADVVRRPLFVTTHWSVVLTAGRTDTGRAGDALAKLCRTYWYPLFAYARRRGYSSEDAKDLTQEFFARLLARRSLARVDPSHGRFRSFILGAMIHFLSDEHAKVRAQKRGGGSPILSLDLAVAERRFGLEPADPATPDQVFDRQWATALLDEVLSRLEDEYRSEGKSGLFEVLRHTLIGARESQPYAELATRAGMSEGAVKTAVHRLRKRYRELLQAEIANTVASPDEVREEMHYLFSVIAGH